MKKQNHKEQLFAIIEKYSNENKLKKLMKKAEELYLMNSFKIKSMSRPEAQQFYWRQKEKYKSGELKIMHHDWHKNQRRLFLWYLVCYSEHVNTTIQNLKQEQWTQMGKDFFDKSPMFLKFQGLTIYKNMKKHPWNENEDKLLEKYVKELGTNQWNQVSKLLFFHNDNQKGNFISSKQCRERWFNHVSKDINKNPWTPQEDIDVLRLSMEMCKKWAAIAKKLGTHRTEHMVKNRFVSIVGKTRTHKKESQESLVEKAIRNLQEKKIQQTREKDSTFLEGNKQPDQKIDSKENANQVLIKQMPFVEMFQQKWEGNFENHPKSQQKPQIKEINIRKSFSAIQQQGNHKDITQGAFNSIATPTTVKPISISPFTFLNNFGHYAIHFEKKRQDGSSLFSPFACTPLPTLNPSPFPHDLSGLMKSSSLYSPVGISALSVDLQEIIRSNKAQQS